MKIVSLPDTNLLKSCYKMLLNYATAGRKNWASEVKEILYTYGFGYIWEQQMVQDKRSFLNMFVERLRDCYIQTWNGLKSATSKLFLYNMYKENFEREPYLMLAIPRRLRRAIAKFRTCSHDLEIEIGRRYGIQREDRLCKACGETNVRCIEDEFHVLVKCPRYSQVREIYLGQIDSTLYSFCSVMKSSNINELIRLANFICSIFEIRQLNSDVI